MPIYEYKCNACGKEFEYQQRMSDPEKTDCEACGKSALERLISRTAFQLKGSGWYKDLYSSAKPEAASSNSSGDSSAASSGDKPAGDKAAPSDKPAAKADTGGSSSGTGGSGGSSS